MTNRESKSEQSAPYVRTAQHSEQVPQANVNAPFPFLWQASGVQVPPVLGSRADIVMIQQLQGNRAVSQMLAVQKAAEAQGLREPSDEEIHSAAAEGIRTPATTLPYLDRIQASFGRHSIGHVKAHVGPEAAQASRAMNALAFASGDHVVLGGTPDLRTAAHEAAHVVQQQAGVQLAGGIGREGDAYERHADAVADAVVAGRSAEGLLKSLVALPATKQSEILTRAPIRESVSTGKIRGGQTQGTAASSRSVGVSLPTRGIAIQRMMRAAPAGAPLEVKIKDIKIIKMLHYIDKSHYCKSKQFRAKYKELTNNPEATLWFEVFDNHDEVKYLENHEPVQVRQQQQWEIDLARQQAEEGVLRTVQEQYIRNNISLLQFEYAGTADNHPNETLGYNPQSNQNFHEWIEETLRTQVHSIEYRAGSFYLSLGHSEGVRHEIIFSLQNNKIRVYHVGPSGGGTG